MGNSTALTEPAIRRIGKTPAGRRVEKFDRLAPRPVFTRVGQGPQDLDRSLSPERPFLREGGHRLAKTAFNTFQPLKTVS